MLLLTIGGGGSGGGSSGSGDNIPHLGGVVIDLGILFCLRCGSCRCLLLPTTGLGITIGGPAANKIGTIVAVTVKIDIRGHGKGILIITIGKIRCGELVIGQDWAAIVQHCASFIWIWLGGDSTEVGQGGEVGMEKGGGIGVGLERL